MECGVDYLTTTWPTAVNDTIMISTSNVMDWAQRRACARGKGDWVKHWAWQGYVGYSCGPVQVGERLDGCILRLSGVAAHDWLTAGFPAGHNISRLDVALTVWGVTEQSTAIARHKDEAIEERNILHSRPFRVTLIDGNGDGDTLYLGSRTSEQFVRIYDKERSPNSEPTYKTALRYEVECKEGLARHVYERCIIGGYSPGNCHAVLTGLLARRGINPLGTRGVQPATIKPSDLRKSSVEDTLSWLETQVRPSVRRLMEQGYAREVVNALGFDELVKIVMDDWQK